MAMKWEFLGGQELTDREEGTRGRGYTYVSLLWRTNVPGGWLLMVMNAKSNDPSPSVSFYPDPEHRWTGAADPQAAYLLRPAEGGRETPADHLLRPGPPPEAADAE